jgi:uncharacterized protein (UPF0548 family)
MSGSDHLTYPGAGATARDAAYWPSGYRRLRVRTRLGSGGAVFRAASRAVLEWRMHRAMGVVVDAGAPGAEPGVRVTVGLGGAFGLLVRGECRVVWAAEEENRAGWAYGTLRGHPLAGEEAFVVTWEDDGGVWLEVTSFSRRRAWWARAAGPLVPVFQRWYARRCGRCLRALAERETGGRRGGVRDRPEGTRASSAGKPGRERSERN